MNDFQSNGPFTPPNSLYSYLYAILPSLMFGKKSLPLWFFVVGDPRPLKITVRRDFDVTDLQKAVKEEYEDFRAVTYSRLLLWKLNVAEPVEPVHTLSHRIESRGNVAAFADELTPTQKVSALFPHNPLEKHVHILVQLVSGGGPVSVVSQLASTSGPVSVMSQLPSTNNPRPPERTRSFPRPPWNTSPRRDTVIALYERLKECGFIQVRGTPASGKTVLAQLLADYIDHIPQQEDEKIHIVWVHGWPAKAERGEHRSYLRWLGWDEKRKKTVFIFDEAQQTYNDSELWSQFFRPMRDYEERRAIIFCGYGSPTLRVSLGGTPLLIADAQRVTLRHIDHQDGLAPVGLLFTRSEFDDLITTRYPSPTFCFDPSFFDALYGITNGHVGAIKDFISIIIADDSYRQLKRTAGRLYTWKSFLDAIGPQELLQKLENSAIVFGRGLPSNDALRAPAIASVFSAVLRKNFVKDSELGTDDEKKALQECFRQGWLHADKLGAMNLLDEFGYLFPSSLHRWYVEWKLSGSLPPTELQANSLLDFVINVIKLFSPNILSAKRRLGPGCIQRLPEAQYQDEFYRCCHVLSRGSLVTFPEFGTTQGLVDFYIPTKSWGIELLVREGNQPASHCGRFSEGGSYRMTLPLSEYIIIDCRTTYPKKKHPLMSNLYHAVFEDNFHNVSILDNGLSVRMNFRLLAM